MNRILLISIAAAICTGIAGILHLSMLPAFNTQMTTLFLVGGLAQVFWIIPTVKNWGKIWDYIGIVGTVAFTLIWIITRIPGNPITGRGGMIGDTAIATEVFQIAFIILMGSLIAMKSSKKTIRNYSEEKS
jgi:ethanolamine transporter EutH